MQPKRRILIIVIIVLLIVVTAYSYYALGVNLVSGYNIPNFNALGYKQNNPGNIRNSNETFDGETFSATGFKAFINMAYGYRALAVVLYNYVTKRGLNTIRKIITEYAPSADGNNTEKYINSVSQLTGINPDKVLTEMSFKGFLGSTPTMQKIMAAISVKEIGYVDEKQLKEGYKIFSKDKL